VASHGKKGLEKVFLGSFAEQLLLQSRVPVIVVGSQTESFADRQPLRVLVPNDLSRPESSFFKNIFQFTRSLKAQATLMSVVTHPIEAVVQSGVFLLSGGWVQVPVYLEAEKTRLKEAAAKLCEQAKAMDVPCEWYQAEARIPVAEAIVQHAKESKAGLIAMAAESGAVASALLGSVTRQVIKSAPCPVLVYRVKS
jgi:nucleotide-binding universal stress UspA family protein